MPKILIADDQYEILQALKLLLKQEGFQTVMATSPEAVLDEALRNPFDLILMDLNYTRDTTSGREGLDLINRLRAMPHAPPVIVMTAWSNVPLAVEAMRLGASDFIEKPWDNTRLLALLRQHLEAGPGGPPAGLTAAADLEIARTVQHRLLPQSLPEIQTLDYAVRYQPAGQVGGDYYDLLPASDDSILFVVADVSGKGISAAILMATIQSFFRSREPADLADLAGLLETLNALFYHSSPAEHYATLFMLLYSERSRAFEWINSGHTPPILALSDGTVAELMPSATVIGMFPRWTGQVRRGVLNVGDTLLIFSDGLTEAADAEQEEFGVDRLLSLWSESRALSAGELVQSVAAAIREHSHGPLVDDLTILALRGREAELSGAAETGDDSAFDCSSAQLTAGGAS